MKIFYFFIFSQSRHRQIKTMNICYQSFYILVPQPPDFFPCIFIGGTIIH